MRAGAAVKGKAALDDADVVAMLRGDGDGNPRSRQGRAGAEDHARRLGAGGAGRGAMRRPRTGTGGCLAAAAAARGRGRGDRDMVAAQGPRRAAGRAGARPRRSGRGLGRGRHRWRCGARWPLGSPWRQLVSTPSTRRAMAQALAYFASTSSIALTLPAERPASSKVWAQKGVGDRLGEFRADDARAHGDDLGVVRQRGALGGIGVVGQRGADARHLVGRDADADAGAADQDARCRRCRP